MARNRVTYGLIGANLLVYLFQIVMLRDIYSFGAKDLFSIGAVYGPAVVLGGEWWRILMAMFMHGGIEHLLLNMFSLFIVGRMIELYFDTFSYLVIYFLSGIVGFILSIYAHPMDVSIGASGAIFGIFGALAGFVISHRKQAGTQFTAFMRQFGLILLLNLGIGIVLPNIDMSAHIGGLLFGMLAGYLASKHPLGLAITVTLTALGIWYAAHTLLPAQFVAQGFIA